MKHVLLLLLLAGGPAWKLLTWVRERNAAAAAGASAYARGNANEAAAQFGQALQAGGRPATNPQLVLNLAHAQARAGQLAAARATYGRLLAGSPAKLGSVARQQLAVLASRQGNVAQALGLLRQALLLDPGNDGARFNFEALTEYVARQATTPRMPTPPPPAGQPKPPKPPQAPNEADNSRAGQQAGADRQAQIDDSQSAGAAPPAAPRRRPNAAGQPDDSRLGGDPGSTSPGSLNPGNGAQNSLATGDAPGQQRGLAQSDAGEKPGTKQSRGAGTGNATAADQRLQT